MVGFYFLLRNQNGAVLNEGEKKHRSNINIMDRTEGRLTESNLRIKTVANYKPDDFLEETLALKINIISTVKKGLVKKEPLIYKTVCVFLRTH